MQQKQQQRSMHSPTEIDISFHSKIPPQALELEEAILGAIMLQEDCIPTVVSLLNIDSFYKSQNQLIYSVILDMYNAGKQIDILTVSETLRNKGKLDEAGGAYYVTMLTSRIASAANIEEHCRLVQEKQIKRALITATNESLNMAYDDVTDPFDCIDVVERSLQAIHEIIASGGTMRPLATILNDVEDEARKREALFNTGQCTGIPTGLSLLNKLTAGWQNGDLIILAGRPSMGKTALMLHHALSAGVSVCIYSLEMSNISLVNRLIISMSNLDPGRFRAGAFSDVEWNEFYKAKQVLSEMPIYIDDNANVSTRYIKSHSKLMKDQGKCDMIFVDYLQLTDMRSDQRGRNREQEVSQTTREMKIIAKSLNVPVMLLSQLSRACESRADKKPILSDLRESGAIEQDADVVIFAYRPDYYGLTDPQGNDQKGLGYEIIAKGRNVGIGEIPFKHNPSMTKIYDYDDQLEGFEQQPNTPF